MPDLKYTVFLDGDASGFGAAAKKTANELNAIDKFESKSRKNQQLLLSNEKQTLQLAKQQRREAFDKLSIEEKTNRLLLQRNRLMQLQERMQARGNMVAASAHRLALAQTNAQLRGLRATGGGAGAGFGMGMMGGGMMRMLGAYLGPMALGYGLVRGVSGRLRRADDIVDTAEQSGLSTEKYLTLQKASESVGVSPPRTFAAMEAMRQSRARALTDTKEAAKWKRFGIEKGQLSGGQDEFDLLLQVQRSLGSGGLDKYDSPILRSMLGRNPGKILSVAGEINKGGFGSKNAAADVEQLAKTQYKIEAFQRGVGETVDRSIGFTLSNAMTMLKAGLGAGMGYMVSGGRIAGAAFGLSKMMGAPIAGGISGTAQSGSRTAATGPLTISSSFARNSIATEADSLTRIGLYRGGQSQGMNLQMQHLQEARRQTQELRMLNYKVAAPNEINPM